MGCFGGSHHRHNYFCGHLIGVGYMAIGMDTGKRARLGTREMNCEYNPRLVQTGLAEIMRSQSSS